MKRAIVIVGTTGTGKTAWGVRLAQKLGTEVISADSQLVYRELEIGTAKPSLEERQGVPHQMMDVAAPNEVFSAAQYQRQAKEHLERLWANNLIPIVVGGTGFYIKALLQNGFIPDVPPDPDFRASLTALAQYEGVPVLHQRLQSLDPQRANDLHPNDLPRLIRALEIIHVTGGPVPREGASGETLSLLWLGFGYGDREQHNVQLQSRMEQMLAAGWLAEVDFLLQRYGPDTHALNVALGYPQLLKVLTEKAPLPEAIEAIHIATRQYARRQGIWFRRNPDINWLDVGVLTPAAQSLLIQSALQSWLA
jgi:tRNA dimethylallyltransferase